MAKTALRFLGLVLLTLGITVSGCQALFPLDSTAERPEFAPGFPAPDPQ